MTLSFDPRPLLRLRAKSAILKANLAALLKAWDESKHRRDQRGRFSSGLKADPKLGGKTSPLSPREAVRDKAHIKQIANDVADKLGFNKNKIRNASEIGIKLWWAPIFGEEDIREHVYGLFQPITGNITVFPSMIGKNKTMLEGVIAHEINHAKFDKYIKDVGDKEILDPNSLEKLWREAGITKYSASFWWDVFQDRFVLDERGKLKRLTPKVNRPQALLAVNETLAEMARMDHQSGKAKFAVSKEWANLYEKVNKHWQQTRR